MDRQKLSRMMDRSERMYLWNITAQSESVPLIYVGAVAAFAPSAQLPP